MYSRDIAVAVRPFTRQPDGDEVIIGNVESGVFLAVPPEAVELLDQLAQGKTVGEASDFYQETYGDIPDLDDFLVLMESKGIVEPAGERGNSETSRSTTRQTPRPRYHFSGFPQPLARFIFSWPVLTGCFLLIGLALAVITRYPPLMPVPGDLYFPNNRTLAWTILTSAYYATVFLHEFGHLVAARALGVNSRMGISHRLWYLVAETDLTGLWTAPKRKRYLPLLAGILIDSTSAALLVLLLFAQHHKWLALSIFWTRLVRAMAFTYVMHIIWEFFLFVRTDIYYVIATLFNCRNLLGDTQAFLRNQAARIISSIRPTDQSGIPASERRMIRAYAVLWVAGRIWALFTVFWVTVPVGRSYLGDLASALRTGYSPNPGNYIDSLLLATYFLLPTVAGFVLWTSGSLRSKRI